MKRYAIFALGLVGAATAFGADAQVEELLSKMRTAYSRTKSARFEVTTDLTQSERKIKVSMKVDFAAPNKMRAQLSMGSTGTATVICNGKSIVSAFGPNISPSQPYGLDALGRSLPANLETLCFFDWKRQLSTGAGGNMSKSKLTIIPSEKWNGKSYLVLEESAPQQDVFVRYFIDPATYLIWRTHSVSLKAKKPLMDARLTRLELGASIDPKVFELPKKK